jgi:hypothetical protein
MKWQKPRCVPLEKMASRSRIVESYGRVASGFFSDRSGVHSQIELVHGQMPRLTAHKINRHRSRSCGLYDLVHPRFVLDILWGQRMLGSSDGKESVHVGELDAGQCILVAARYKHSHRKDRSPRSPDAGMSCGGPHIEHRASATAGGRPWPRIRFIAERHPEV